jgi:hypothetical protein
MTWTLVITVRSRLEQEDSPKQITVISKNRNTEERNLMMTLQKSVTRHREEQTRSGESQDVVVGGTLLKYVGVNRLFQTRDCHIHAE